MKLKALLATGTCLALIGGFTLGCQGRPNPFLGHWEGGFIPDGTVDSKLVLKGYVQIYLSGDKFLMELANSSQHLRLTGKWAYQKNPSRPQNSGKTVALRVKDLKIDELPLERLTALGRPFIAPEALHHSFEPPIFLTMSDDLHQLTAASTVIGPMAGHLEFTKANTVIGPGASPTVPR